MKKTKFAAKSIIDGIFAYSLTYGWTALFAWIGLLLFHIYAISFWQVLGTIIVLRQLRALIFMPGDFHLKSESKTIKIIQEYADSMKKEAVDKLYKDMPNHEVHRYSGYIEASAHLSSYITMKLYTEKNK
jgi:hypothetical protein